MNKITAAIVFLGLFSNYAYSEDCDKHTGVYGCDASYLVGAYDSTHIETAKKYAIYGLLSNNAYSDTEKRPHFNLPEEWHKLESVTDPVGLDFDTYEKKIDNNLLEVVIAFRGTQGIKDWINGDFSNKEYDVARGQIQKVLDKYKGQGVPIVATGHSLGGGLAIFASYQFPGITAIGFNSSPRYHSKYHKEKNTRVIIFEKGDATRIAGNIFFPWRWGGLAKKMDIYYQKYDFIDGNPIAKHFSFPLVRGILMVGSLADPELAKLLKNNRDVPKKR